MQDLIGTRDALRQCEEVVAEGDRSRIVALVEDLLGAGAAPPDLLTGVVAAAQRTIGERWQRGE